MLPETGFREKHGVWDPMPELTLKVSYTVHPHYKRKKGWSGEDLSYWLSTFVSVCMLISKTAYGKRESMEKGEGRGESLPYVCE
jgi:hypothetical protein